MRSRRAGTPGQRRVSVIINLNVAEAIERVRLVLHEARRKRLQAG